MSCDLARETCVVVRQEDVVSEASTECEKLCSNKAVDDIAHIPTSVDRRGDLDFARVCDTDTKERGDATVNTAHWALNACQNVADSEIVRTVLNDNSRVRSTVYSESDHCGVPCNFSKNLL